jgi:hypothetical protein
MKIEMSQEEVKLIAKVTNILKFKILSEMVDWTVPFEKLVLIAEKEYNELRQFAGQCGYPYGKCNNIVELFRQLKETQQ